MIFSGARIVSQSPMQLFLRPDGFPEGRIFMLQTRGAPEVFGVVTTQQPTNRPPLLQQYRVRPPCADPEPI